MPERSAVQEPLLKYANEIGWTRVSRAEAMQLRGGNIFGLYFTDVLNAQLKKLNKGIIDDSNCDDVIRRLDSLKSTLDGNQNALSWMHGRESTFVHTENRQRNVTLIDFEHPDNNLFHVTDEWEQKGVVHTNRADVVLLINGIPVTVVETKPADKRDGLEDGVDQIFRYHNETPEMFTTAQLFAVTDMLNLLYSVTWNTNRKNIFNWKSDESANYEQKVKTFFDRERILQVLHRFVIFQSRDEKLSKVVLRQHQTRAVEKVIDRVNDTAKQHGLVWHTQGSGKTLTMISIASRLLRGGEQTEKPTVLMVVDRNELESQLFKNINAYGITTLEVAQSRNNLESILSSGYRGLIVSTIHKFDKRPANLNTHESTVVLIDEAHRTTGGDFGNYLMAAIPNATYIGFTGTPIDTLSKGEGTFKVFGKDDEKGYLDKYGIAESIEDGTTLSLNYALAPSNLRIDPETLDSEFLSLAAAKGISDPDELNAILDDAVNLKVIMKAPNRVEAIAKFVAEDFKEKIEPMGFKAFLVGVDREACALYKQELDKYLPTEYSKVVYSKNNNDNELMKNYHLSDEQEKEIRKNFINKNSQPKILIVTQKLLTGYDAPILYCMYLDKPMRDHVLLQAIARVNRPYEDDDGLVKPAGFVLDFVGIFEKLEKALAFDSDEVENVLQNIDKIKDRFKEMMQGDAQKYLPLTDETDDKAIERAIEYFADKDDRETFFTFFKQLQNLYNIISPDPFLHPFLQDYKALASLYRLIHNKYSDNIPVDKELVTKTQELLQTETEGNLLDATDDVYELNETSLMELSQSDVPDTVKVLNLRKVLRRTVANESEAKPFLIPIGERTEAVIENLDNRQLDTKDALTEFMKFAIEISRAEREQNDTELGDNAYAIFTVLRNVKDNITPEQAQSVNQIFEKYPDHQWDDHQAKTLRSMLYKTLSPTIGTNNLIETTNKLLKLKRV